MFSLIAEVQVTRRQRLSHVLDETGTVVWSGKSVVSAVEYLHENDQKVFRLEGDFLAYVLSIDMQLLSTDPIEPDKDDRSPI